MKQILITGGNGYLGGVIAPYLVDNKYGVTVYDACYFDDCTLYTPVSSYKIIKGDMRSLDESLLDGVFAVIHLSAISNDPLNGLDAKTFYHPTRKYSLELAMKCKRKGIKFIFASSCSIYGKSDVKDLLNEEAPTNPQTPYSINKQEIENDLRDLCDETFRPVFLRFATAFGLSPRLRFDLIVNMFTGQAYTRKKIVLNSNGLAWRPIVHINDIAKAVLFAIDYNHEETTPLVLNIGHNSMNYTVLEIAKIVKTIISGTQIEFMNFDKKATNADELIKDRKVTDGVDSRTYRVNFDKIRGLYPDFANGYALERGIEEIVNKFNEISLTSEQFNDIRYYRLQKMEHLLSHKKIDKNLFWLKK